jgi:hypothetical protein
VIDQAKIDELTRRLDPLRQSILSVPGVIGVGIGLADEAPRRPQIRIFVVSAEDIPRATGPLRSILTDLEFDVEIQGESYGFTEPNPVG